MLSRLPDPDALAVSRVAAGDFPSPLPIPPDQFVDDDDGVLVASAVAELGDAAAPLAFEAAGPRVRLAFEPATTRCGIVTCGGLCPGINDVIRAIVLTLHHAYGVREIVGFRHGYAGLDGDVGHEPLRLSPEIVQRAHRRGGSLLGTSRGPRAPEAMVDTLVGHGVDVLFTIGGDGTLRGATTLVGEIRRRDLQIAVIGLPKTIDNDIGWIQRSFGFATAVDEATRAIDAAHTEAEGAHNGVGLVKLMGRHCGLIAAHACLANADVNFCLVPEVPFALEGDGGLLDALGERLRERQHAVIVVAEGAGQELVFGRERRFDSSGNLKLADIGPFLKARILAYLRAEGIDGTVKYIDPSYLIRSLPANSADSELCLALGQHAVHAGMVGRTDTLVGSWNDRFVHVPIPLAVKQSRQLDPEGAVWQRVLGATGQPRTLSGGQPSVPEPA